jgi:hypothetical protein
MKPQKKKGGGQPRFFKNCRATEEEEDTMELKAGFPTREWTPQHLFFIVDYKALYKTECI